MDPSSSAVSALSTTAFRGAPTGMIKSPPGILLDFSSQLLVFHLSVLLLHIHIDDVSVSLQRHPITLLLAALVIPNGSQYSPHVLSNKTSASHFYSKEPDLPSILLTVLHQLLLLQVHPLKFSF